LIHQPHGGSQGQATDMEIQMEEMRLARRMIEDLLARHTGQDREKVAADIERDYIVRGDEAVEYGLVDDVVMTRRPGERRQRPGYLAITPGDRTESDSPSAADADAVTAPTDADEAATDQDTEAPS
ncbi:MAG: ATP-dependent Clp protease proteolytic subunit, partial [Actinomycetota bacterium]